MKPKTKDEFIGEYLDKHMKGHGLPYGMQYFNLLEKVSDKAELAYKCYLRKLKNKKDESSKISGA